MKPSEKDSLVRAIAERAKEDRALAIAAFAAGDDGFCFRWSMGTRSPSYRGTKFYADGSSHEVFIAVNESEFGAMVREAIATARAEGYRAGLERAAEKCEDHCRHVTRLCVASCEEPCAACLAARDIRALADAGEDA